MKYYGSETLSLFILDLLAVTKPNLENHDMIPVQTARNVTHFALAANQSRELSDDPTK